jgi:hypothetical protein
VTSALEPIATGLLDTYAPLDRALHDPQALRLLLRNLGWAAEIEAALLSDEPYASLAADTADLIQQGTVLVADLSDADGDNDAAFEALLGIIGSLQSLIAGLGQLDDAGPPPGVEDPSFWAELALDLPEYLIIRYLECYQVLLYGLLRLAGVIEDDPGSLGGGNGRSPYVRRRIVWDNLVALLGGPAEHLQRLYHWDDGFPFDHPRLLDELARFGRSVGVRVERLSLRHSIVEEFYGGEAPDSDVRETVLPILSARDTAGLTRQGVLLAPVPRQPKGDVDGLYLTNLSWGRAGASQPLTAPWMLTVSGTLDLTGVVGAHVYPGHLEFPAEPVGGSAEIAVEGTPESPWRLLGAPTGPRVELNGLRLAVAFEASGQADVSVAAKALPSADRGGIAVTIDPAEGDAFVQGLIPASVQADADPELRWSARDGLSLTGGAGLDVVVPVEKSVGPITVDSLHIALSGGDGTAAFLFAVTGGVSQPPLDIVVLDVGLELELGPGVDGGLIDGLGVSARFKPPDGAGVTLDLAPAASGGGFAGYFPDTGRYVGDAAFEFVEVGLSAVIVVDTKLPGDPGWALFASVAATFPGLPLGFGFLLTGVGGIFALNRTMDVDALAEGIKSGAADAIMFPDDPAGDCALLVSQLDAWFPVAEGSAVFGVDAQLAWGTGALVTGELGVVVSFPDLDLIVLGTIESVLPNADAPELELHMDALGVIDLGEGTVWITAALYDSALAQTIHVSGGMALYARFTDDPFFLLSVGGYHPSFQPPGGLPGAVLDLDRMRAEVTISDDVHYSLEAYFAVTSNTLQFGAEASLEVSSRFLGVTYTARGEVGFDVLLVFSPFAFVVDFEASVTVTAGSGEHELLAVDLSAHLEGPKPWYATGHASFDFLGIDVPFEIEVGASSPPEAPALQDVLELVKTALEDAAAWRAIAPGTSIVLADDAAVAGEDEVWARPDAELEAIQDVAPLDRALDHFGAYEITGPSTLTLSHAGVDGADGLLWEEGIGYFAPAQYDDMTRSEKLAAPSYEPMTAGVSFGGSAIALPPKGQVRTVTPTYEQAVVDGEQRIPHGLGGLELPMQTATFAHMGERKTVVVDGGPFALEPVTWSTVDSVTGVADGSPGTYRDALQAARAAPRGTQKIAPAYASRDAAPAYAARDIAPTDAPGES